MHRQDGKKCQDVRSGRMRLVAWTLAKVPRKAERLGWQRFRPVLPLKAQEYRGRVASMISCLRRDKLHLSDN